MKTYILPFSHAIDVAILSSIQVTAENKKLTKPLENAQIELAELRRKLEHFNKERSALSRTKQQFAISTKQLNEVKWETEALRMRCEKLTEERDQLRGKFEETAVELQQKMSMKNLLSERKLTSLQKEHEKLEVVLGEVLRAAGMEPHDLTHKVEKLLKHKNDKIENLQYELAKVCKSYDDLLRTVSAKMEQFGITKEELGFEPLRINASVKYSTGGLVAKTFMSQFDL